MRNLSGDENMEDKQLYGEYMRILEELGKIDDIFVQTTDQDALINLIEQRKPLQEQLSQIYAQIIQGEREQREEIIKQAQKAAAWQ